MELVERGIVDPRVEYNLGNAEFRRGRARAARSCTTSARERLEPADADIRANLSSPGARCSKRASETLPAPIAWARAVAQDRLGPDATAWIALGLVWLAAVCSAWRPGRSGSLRALHGWMLGGAPGRARRRLATWYITHRQRVSQRVAVVLAREVAVLAGPGENNASSPPCTRGSRSRCAASARTGSRCACPTA